MGLALEVGVLADLKGTDEEASSSYWAQFEIINRVLRAEGLADHSEPQEPDETFSCFMLGYGGLHYLRRVAAHLALDRRTPPPGDKDADKDPILHEECWERFKAGKRLKYQHLIIHSDAEGFYVPVDFARPIFVTNLQLAGGLLGSTPQLRAECADLVDVLGMPVEMDHESDELFEATKSQGRGQTRWQQYAVETFTCLRLLAACGVSLRTKAAIVFV